MSEVYGTPPGWRVESYKVDRNGAITLEVALPWTPMPETTDLVLRVSQFPVPPSIPGYGFMGGQLRRTRDGGLSTVYAYGTLADSFGDVAQTEEPGVSWSISGSFRGRSILTHPNIAALKEKYGWDDVRRAFKERREASTQGNGWKKETEQPFSEMYGVTSYDDLSATLTKTFIARRPPAELLTGAGQIVKSPWKALGNFDDGRDWMVLPGAADPHGNVWRISISYLLSGPGGHNRDVYGAGLLSKKSGGNNLAASTPRLDAAFGA